MSNGGGWGTPGTSAPKMPRHDVPVVQVNKYVIQGELFLGICIGNLERQLTAETAIKLADLIYEATDDD